jgi:RNA exonuclease 4
MMNSDSPQPQEKTAKKRTRGRRRKSNNKEYLTNLSTENDCCGYVSESSSESSKLSITPKKSKAIIVPQEEQAQYLALDCEMVGVGVDGHRSMLARVTIVNWDGDIVYDQLIRPSETVTDYRTFVSGITAADLENDDIVTDFHTCRTYVLDLIQNKIIVGHALKNDLSALQIKHPWQQIRDTAKYEPFMKQRFEDGVYWPRKLKELVYENIDGMEIQQPGKPHSAYEDAYAAIQLYQTVRNKWEKVMKYKIMKTAQIEQQQQMHLLPHVVCEDDLDNSKSTVDVPRNEEHWPKLISQNA